MNNDELKKKIVEIIIDAIWKDAEADYDSTDESEARTIADTLIEAWIGDIKEAEHRATVIELALDNMAEFAYENSIERETMKREFIKQAEKELAEERKIDQTLLI